MGGIDVFAASGGSRFSSQLKLRDLAFKFTYRRSARARVAHETET